MLETFDLGRMVRDIYADALKSVDAGDAVRRAVRLDGSSLLICNTNIEQGEHRAGIYACAIGKAALPMARALDERLCGGIVAGLVAGTRLDSNRTAATESFTRRWQVIEGGHPLPDEASLQAAQSAFDLLHRADKESALIIFLISGGGSALIEWPCDERITLADLRAANRLLVSCGANIAEVNAVRRAFSAIKGGRLSERAPNARQVNLIINDTRADEEYNVASGPTLPPPVFAPTAAAVVSRYGLETHLPPSIMRAINHPEEKRYANVAHQARRQSFVLLDNERALEAAALAARARSFLVEVARDVADQPVEEGYAQLIERLFALRRRARQQNRLACLISGGEFACPYSGAGRGGRNAETVLRWAIALEERIGDVGEEPFARFAFLSAGTDGIDGNSPAAGALASETTMARARALGLDASEFLAASDAYSFFYALGDALLTGPTGTNVRDLRIMLAV